MFNINRFTKEIERIKSLRKTQDSLSLEKKAELKKNILYSLAQESLRPQPLHFWVKYKYKMLHYTSAIMVGISVFGGTAFASTNSLPGQVLYNVKRVTEKLQLRVTVSEETKANLQAKFAQKRLHELGELHKLSSVESKVEQNSEASNTPQTVALQSTLGTTSLINVNKAKSQESEIEKKAKIEAGLEVRQALATLSKVHKKLQESGEFNKAQVLQDNILKLKVSASEKNIQYEDDEINSKDEKIQPPQKTIKENKIEIKKVNKN